MTNVVTIERYEDSWCSFDADDQSDAATLTVCFFQESCGITLSPDQALKLANAIIEWAKRKAP